MMPVECPSLELMDVEQLEDIAFNGGPMPALKSQAQYVLFQAFRNLYDYAKRSQMPMEQGRREKAQIMENYRINLFLEEQLEQTNKMWKAIELTSAAYAKDPSVETADKLYEAIYRVKRKGAAGVNNDLR